jgi:hypothetical protein
MHIPSRINPSKVNAHINIHFSALGFGVVVMGIVKAR